MTNPSLRRYTNLSSTIHILKNRCLTLLSPNSWDDKNDAYYISEYQTRIAAKSVLALCFAEAVETYHHWKVFSSGSDGVCIEFDKTKLQTATNRASLFSANSVEYKTIENTREEGLAEAELPFLKRYPYKDEKEFRLLFVDRETEKEFQHFNIKLSWINRITLSPWMPIPLSSAVKSTLKQMDGCNKLKISRSTLIENEQWKKFADDSSPH